MVDRPHFGALHREFVSGDPLTQERLFALSCFDLSHWEEDPNWSIDIDSVASSLRREIRRLIGSGRWGDFIDQNGEEWLDKAVHRGVFANYLLSWFLAQKLGYSTERETLSNSRPFDVQLYDGDIPVCDIEIKRLASSNSIETEAVEHRERCRSEATAPKSILFVYFPLGDEEDSRRVNDYLHGYIYSFSHHMDFYSSEDNFICPIPASIQPTDEEIHPLRKSAQVLRDVVGIRQRP